MCIGPAIPKISTQFNAIGDVGWYGTAYLLTITATQPTYGKVFQYFNPKLVYLLAIGFFEGSSHYSRL
jgi:MFS family permease